MSISKIKKSRHHFSPHLFDPLWPYLLPLSPPHPLTFSSSKADNRNQNDYALSRHSGMPSAGIQSTVFLDSGQNRAGMTVS